MNKDLGLGINKSMADKVSKNLDKEKTYTLSELSKELAKVNIAAPHSKVLKEIGEELKELGFKIDESRIFTLTFESFNSL